MHKIIAKNLKRHVLFASYKVHCRNVWTTYLNDVQFVVDKEYDVIRLLFKADSLCILPHFTSCTEAKNFFETLLRYLSNLSDDLTNLNTMVNHFLVASSSPG